MDMNKIHRDSTDINIAFSSGMNTLRSKDVEPDDSVKSSIENLYPIRIRVKKLLRSTARLVYKLVRPVLRPITFRLKQHFIANLNQASATTLQEVQSAKEEIHALRQEAQKLLSSLEHAGAHSEACGVSIRKELRTTNPSPALRAPSPRSRGEGENEGSSLEEGIIVVGAGGHAKVCIELLQAMGEQVIYCIGNENSPELCLGIPVLKGDAQLKSLRAEGYKRLFIALGSNELREERAAFAIGEGYQLINAISPQAIISPSVSLGSGIAVMAGAIINADTVIADLAIINTGATVDHDCYIGKGVHIAPQCTLAGKVNIGRQSFLGVGCKVIPEIVIGEKVTAGAGSVIIANINSGMTVVGAPARIITQQNVEKKTLCNEFLSPSLN